MEWFVAWRYFKSKKKTNAINIISGITVSAFAIATAAMVIVVSALNGFESIVKNLYKNYDPEIIIVPKKGKFISHPQSLDQALSQDSKVIRYAHILEEKAVLKFNDIQEIVNIIGVDDQYANTTQIKKSMVEGSFLLYQDSIPFANLGYGLTRRIGLNTDIPNNGIDFYFPKNLESTSMLNMDQLTTLKIQTSGAFLVQEDIDQSTVIVPIAWLKKLTGYHSQVSKIAILCRQTDSKAIEMKLEKQFNKDYDILNRLEQKESIFKIFQNEKWATFGILSFILLIASFNIIGSLTMIKLEKNSDFNTLRFLGVRNGFSNTIIKKIGFIITIFGTCIGVVLGILICLAQIKFGFITISNSIVDQYPIEIIWKDILIIISITASIGIVTSLITSIFVNTTSKSKAIL